MGKPFFREKRCARSAPFFPRSEPSVVPQEGKEKEREPQEIEEGNEQGRDIGERRRAEHLLRAAALLLRQNPSSSMAAATSSAETSLHRA